MILLPLLLLLLFFEPKKIQILLQITKLSKRVELLCKMIKLTNNKGLSITL